MPGDLKAWLAGLIVLFIAAALPIFPETQSASAKLRVTGVEQTATLLGEASPGTQAPPEVPPSYVSGAKGAAMTITIPRLGIRDVAVPTGSTQARLDQEGIIHLAGSGVPWLEGSNTFIVGHRLGFDRTRVPYVFYRLDGLRPGDRVVIRDGAGESYVFRVYDRLTVLPADYWVTHPVPGKTTISLQTCTPIPSFEKRLIVRGELVS